MASGRLGSSDVCLLRVDCLEVIVDCTPERMALMGGALAWHGAAAGADARSEEDRRLLKVLGRSAIKFSKGGGRDVRGLLTYIGR